MAREYKVSECKHCHRVRYIAARGWCRACWSRWQRHGTVELKKRTRTKCKVDECERVVVSHGFCDKHWHRVVTTGDPHRTLRPDDWGRREVHPLYYSWSYAKQNSGLADRWLRFWNFVADVKDRPTPVSKLRKLRETEALGPDNYEWREPIWSRSSGAEYNRSRRKNDPDYFRNADLKKKFGISLTDYQTMLESQDGVCAICEKEDGVVDRRTGKPRKLAVDHCHKTGHIRKLLCGGCNSGLGSFRDDPSLLRKAAAYLEN